MKKKNEGFVLVFVIISLAIAMGIFFRYSMNTRAKKLKIVEKRKLFDIEESIKKALSAGINETYLIDQMIINRKDYNFNNVSGIEKPVATGGKETIFNVYRHRDYFIVKDKYYEEVTPATDPVTYAPVEKIWQTGASSEYNIEKFWVRVNKVNTGGRISQTDPNYYVGGKNTFTLGIYDKEVRFSKGGYYMKSIEVNEVSKATNQCEDRYLYFAKYSEFNSTSNETCYLREDGSGGSVLETNNYQSTAVDYIATVDPIDVYLNNVPGVTLPVSFIVRVKKDMAYQVISSDEIVAAFETIADLKVTYSSTRDSGTPDSVEILNYEVNHLGPEGAEI